MGSTLNRQQMAEVLRNRGSVAYQGRIIKDISEIPSEADLAVGNPVEEKAAESNILAEMARLKEELAKLKATPVEEDKNIGKVRKVTEDKSVPATT